MCHVLYTYEHEHSTYTTRTVRSELLYELSRTHELSGAARAADVLASAAPAWQQQRLQQQDLTGWPLADHSGVGQPLKRQQQQYTGLQPQQLPPLVCAPAAEPVPFQQLLLQRPQHLN